MRYPLDVVPLGLKAFGDSCKLFVVSYIVNLCPSKALRVVGDRVLVLLGLVVAFRL